MLAADLADRVEGIDVNPLICTGQRIVAVDALVVAGSIIEGEACSWT